MSSMSLLAAGITLAALGAAVLATPAGPVPQAGRTVAIVGVTVVDPSSSMIRRDDQTIVIRGERIVEVGPRALIPIPAGARRIDGVGRYVVPGLWDAHVHFMNAGVTALQSLVAYGVTSVREMGGYLDSTRAWQARMRAGALVGPRIVTAGPLLENPRYLEDVRRRDAALDGRLAPRILPYRLGIGDTASARRVVDSLATLGVDFVKFRTVASPAVFGAIVGEAHRRGLLVAGHAPGVVSPAAAADSGQDDFEHALYPISDSARGTRARAFAERGTWYTPTLVASKSVLISGDSADHLIFGAGGERDPRRALASPWLLGWWRMQVDERQADTSTAAQALTRQVVESSVREVGELARAGVRILAGTDAGSVLVYPGPSLHEELSLLVQAGLTPQQALWSATTGPAGFARLDSVLGRINPGYVADLVLLDADPLADIRNTRTIRAVVQAGRVFDRAALDALLAEVRRQNGR